MDLVRFTNSGTESTMHAIRVGRAHSGKDKVLKIEGSYHGCHDYVLFNQSSGREKLGHAERPTRVVESTGVPEKAASCSLIRRSIAAADSPATSASKWRASPEASNRTTVAQ